MFGWQQSDRKYFSVAELTPFLKKIDEQGEQADKLQSVQRSAYQNAIINLRNALVLYQRLKNSIQPEGAGNFLEELQSFESALPDAAKAARHREGGEKFDQTKLDRISELMQRYDQLAETAYLLPVPPPPQSTDWRSIGQAVTQSITEQEIHPVVKTYASLGDAYRAGDRVAFGKVVDQLAFQVAQQQPAGASRARYEFLFNQARSVYP